MSTCSMREASDKPVSDATAKAVAGTLDEVLPFLSSQLQWREQVLLDQVLLAIGFATGWIYSYIAVRRYIREAAKPL